MTKIGHTHTHTHWLKLAAIITAFLAILTIPICAHAAATDWPGTEQSGDITGNQAYTHVNLKIDDSKLSFTAPTIINYCLDGAGSFITPDPGVAYFKNNSIFNIKINSYDVTAQSGAKGVADLTGETGADTWMLNVTGNNNIKYPFAIDSPSGWAGWKLEKAGAPSNGDTCGLTFTDGKMINPTASKWHNGANLESVEWNVSSEAGDNLVTCYFDNGDGTGVTQTVTKGSNFTKPIIEPTREYCKFDGYYTDAALTNPAAFPIVADNYLTLFTKWKSAIKDHLDEYTIPELKAASADLEANGTSSPYYAKFYEFMADDEIWWCNSNCQQPDTCTALDSTTFDVSKANHDYVCNYTRDNDDTNIDNYPMMRVIGVLHDYKAGTTKTTKEKAGLTFMYIHCICYGNKAAQEGECWWGMETCDLRNKLQSGGSIFNETNSAVTSQIQAVDKWYQTNYQPIIKVNIAISQDQMFVPSYSELWNKNEYSSYSLCSTYNNVASFDGDGNPESEGYVYEWAKLHDIDGNAPNTILAKLGYTNSNINPHVEDDWTGAAPFVWERSRDYNTLGWGAIQPPGLVQPYMPYNTPAAYAPCFCF